MIYSTALCTYKNTVLLAEGQGKLNLAFCSPLMPGRYRLEQQIFINNGLNFYYVLDILTSF